jgi:hypothetical protein
VDPHYLALLVPDPYWECGSGFISKEIYKNIEINLILAFLKVITYIKYLYFHVKIQLLVTEKFDQDPDPH